MVERVVWLMLVAFVVTEAKVVTQTVVINGKSTCGDTITVPVMTEVNVKGVGESKDVDCSYLFKAEVVDNCAGLCYQFHPNSYFNSPKVNLVVVLGSDTKTFDSTTGRNVHMGPVCSNETTLAMSLTEAVDYVMDNKNKGYMFEFEVYNKCGKRGSTKNIKFEEAIKNLEGYHHGEAFGDNVRGNFVSGILLGFGLASIFLVVLLIAWCYTRNSPNRGPNRSVGMPKVGGFKKKMKPNKEPKKHDEEMGVSYKSTNPDTTTHKPETKPLLVVTTTKTKDSDDEEEETKAPVIEQTPEPEPKPVVTVTVDEVGDSGNTGSGVVVDTDTGSGGGGGYSGGADYGSSSGGGGDTGGSSGGDGGGSGGGGGGDD